MTITCQMNQQRNFRSVNLAKVPVLRDLPVQGDKNTGKMTHSANRCMLTESHLNYAEAEQWRSANSMKGALFSVVFLVIIALFETGQFSISHK